MERAKEERLATAIVFVTGALWGFYWIPVRAVDAGGLSGAWGTCVIGAAALVFLLPLIVRRRTISACDRTSLVFIAVGGAAFALYSVGFLFGRVAMIILLYFLTPVWSVLIARFVLGWDTPALRLVAILVGLAGLGIMLGGSGGLPLPRSSGEWMALAAGVLWSVSTTGIRIRPEIPPVEAPFVFALGAVTTAAIVASAMNGQPLGFDAPLEAKAFLIAIATGVVWWGASIAALLWAAARLDPARVGLLLMGEVLVGAGTAAILAGERLSATEWLGGALVLTAGVMEIWPVRSARR